MENKKVSMDEKERRKRIYRKTIAFNGEEQKLIDSFCKRYGVKNRTKLFREAIITVMLQKMVE
ncbi:MAG: hypothetical protein LBB79_03270, partial [Prevotellaceae bacterium]|nr:hypothetical protein [Prevotellaceae bacterium]